jgi:antitoxin ParD1/3/4
MANVEKISLAMTPEMASTMRSVVEAGEYASTSEVVREALREWHLRRANRERVMDRLGHLWDEAFDGSESLDGPGAMSALSSDLETYIARRDAR